MNLLKPCVGKIVRVCIWQVRGFTNLIKFQKIHDSILPIKLRITYLKETFHKFVLTKLLRFSTGINASLSSPSQTFTLCIFKPQNYLFHVLSSSNTFHIALVWQSPTQSQSKEVCHWGSCPECKSLGALTHGKS